MEEMFSEDSKDELIEIEPNKKSFITCAKLNKYFFIPFLSPIFCMLTNFFLGKMTSTNVLKNLEFIGSIFLELSYISGGLLHFTSYFRQKAKKIDKTQSRGIELIYNEKRKDYKNYKMLLLITLLGFLLALTQFIGIYTRGKILFNYRLYFLFFIPILSKFILREKKI